MATSDQMRERLLDRPASIQSRPRAWGPEAGGVIRQTIDDLFFLDDRSVDLAQALHKYGKRGVAGPFRSLFDEGHYIAEQVSVFAAIAVDQGYLQSPSGRSGTDRLAYLTALDEVDIDLSSIIEDLGEPDLNVGDEVLCYATPKGWAFCDLTTHQPADIGTTQTNPRNKP